MKKHTQNKKWCELNTQIQFKINNNNIVTATSTTIIIKN